jgi:transcriptional regulator with XRE-family HTH domain/KaiC/GvpD/RAD55 family RecA-like ATPase
MAIRRKQVSSGMSGLDKLLNGLFIGDNVVLYDDAGSLASEFSLQFINESQKNLKPIVYVSFDRSPKNLIETLGELAENQQLTILDCFTNGKGDKADVFNKFYEKDGAQWPYQVIKVTKPWDPKAVFDAIYNLHKGLTGDVRFVMESLTGMQDLWEGEEHILKFYSHSCPKLYEMDTIAYWIIEKKAHSSRLKAHINQVAQVAIDLSMEQGRSKIKILKAEKRAPKAMGLSFPYTFSNGELILAGNQRENEPYNLGAAIKTFRQKQGMSQKELSHRVGVTPSNISQIESNQVFPSLPALYRISENLCVDVGSFFKDSLARTKTIFSPADATRIKGRVADKNSMEITQLTPLDLDGPADSFLVKILPGKKISSHFFAHKGEEMGYLLTGTLTAIYENQPHELIPGGTIYFKTIFPEGWHNTGRETAVLHWLKFK